MLAILTVIFVSSIDARNSQFEQSLKEQYEKVEAGLGHRFELATAALDAEKFEEAGALFEELTKKAPELSGAYRRLASVRSSQGRHDEAVALAEMGQQKEPGTVSELGLMQALVRRKKDSDLARAKRLSMQIKAETGTEDWVQARMLSCQIDIALHLDVEAAICGEELLGYVPQNPFANYLGIYAAMRRDDFQLARERLVRASPMLDEEAQKRVAQTINDNEPLTSRWGPRLGRIGAGWAAIFALMAGLGLMLSALTMRAARTLATERELHAQQGAKILRGIYRAVVMLGSVFYYVSLPVIAAVVLGFFGGLIYVSLAFGHIPIKLVLIAVVMGAMSIFALVKSLFVRTQDEDPGLALDFEKEPRFKAFVDEVARRVGTRTVDKVFLTPGTDLAVFERGPLLKRLRGQGERCLIVGRGVLDGFQQCGFRSVLAHEFGHFSHEDTAGGDVALAARRSLLRMGMALAQSGAAAWYNPAWLFFRAYYAVYLRISQGASRLQEVLADRVAIFSFGSAAFANGYNHVIAQSVRFDSHVGRTLKEVIDSKLPLGNLYRFTPQAQEVSTEIDEAVRATLERPADAYDSHPSSQDRLTWASMLDVPASAEPSDSQLVLDLFDHLDTLENEMTEMVRLNVFQNHDVLISRADSPDEEEAKPLGEVATSSDQQT